MYPSHGLIRQRTVTVKSYRDLVEGPGFIGKDEEAIAPGIRTFYFSRMTELVLLI
jgi:hypothetical protein